MPSRRRILISTTAALLALAPLAVPRGEKAEPSPSPARQPSPRPAPAPLPPLPSDPVAGSLHGSASPGPSLSEIFHATPPGPAAEGAFAAWAEQSPLAALAASLAPDASGFLASLQPVAAAAAARRDLPSLLVWISAQPDTRATPAVLAAAAVVATREHPDPFPDGALALVTELFAGLPPSPAREALWTGWLDRHLDAHPQTASAWVPEVPPPLSVTDTP